MTARELERKQRQQLEQQIDWVTALKGWAPVVVAVCAVVALIAGHPTGFVVLMSGLLQLTAVALVAGILVLVLAGRRELSRRRRVACCVVCAGLGVAGIESYRTGSWAILFIPLLGVFIAWTHTLCNWLTQRREIAEPHPLMLEVAKIPYQVGVSMGRFGGPFTKMALSISTGRWTTVLATVVTVALVMALPIDAGVGFLSHYFPAKPKHSGAKAGNAARPDGGRHGATRHSTHSHRSQSHLPPRSPEVNAVHATTNPAATETPSEVSWQKACGAGRPLPGYDDPPAIAAEFRKLFIGPGSYGGGDPRAGCTGRTKPVPGQPGVLYVSGISSHSTTASIAAVWRDGGGSYEGAIVLAPATEEYWKLLLTYGPVRASKRIDVGGGDFVVMWTPAGTTVLVRSQKWFGDQAAPYVVLGPAASDYWERAMAAHDEWLWPEVTRETSQQTSYNFVHDTILNGVVESITVAPEQTTGRQLSLALLDHFAQLN